MNFSNRTVPRRPCDRSGRCVPYSYDARSSAQVYDNNNLSLALATVPMQVWSQPYPIDQGLDFGTIFADLNMPFYGSRFRCGSTCAQGRDRRECNQ